MNSVRFTAFVWGVTLFSVLLIVLASSLEPEGELATHFDWKGDADGWMSVSQLRTFSILMVLGLGGGLVALFWALRFVPPAMLNIPNKFYWKKPANRDLACRRLLELGFWLANACVVWYTALHVLLIRANRSEPVEFHQSWLWSITGVFVAVIGLWLVAVYRSFRVPV